MSAEKISESIGSWAGALGFSLFILWEVGQAILFGRMDDFFDEDRTHVYFHDSPVWFGIQFFAFVGFGAWLARWAIRRARTGED